MLTIGLAVTTITLIMSVIIFVKRKEMFSKFMIWRTSIGVGIGMILLLTSELSIVKLQYRNYPDYIRAYENYLNDPENEELIQQMEMEYYRIELTEEEFLPYEKSMHNEIK